MFRFLLPTLGAAVALAGSDKLTGNRAYERMFRHLGWSRGEMALAATAEVVGGALMVPRATRRLGAVLVATTSAAVLTSELRHEDPQLAGPRGLVLLAALIGVFAPGRSRR